MTEKIKPDFNVYAKTKGVFEIGVTKQSKLKYNILKTMKTEATIKICLLVPELITRSRIKNYVNETYPDIQKFIRENLNEIKYKRLIRNLFSYRWVGASVGELIYEYRDSKVGLKDILILNPNTWFNTGIKETEIWQNNGARIPKDKCVLYINEDEFGEGTSILEGSCYDYWIRKNRTLDRWDLAQIKFADPSMWATVENATEIKAKEVSDALLDFSESKVGAFSKEVDIHTIQIPDFGDNYLVALHYYDKMIARSLLIPSLVIEGQDEGKGTYGLGSIHFDYFWLTLQSIIEEFCERFVEQVIRRLIDFNYANVKDYGYFNVDDLKEEDYVKWSQIFLNLTNAGYLNSLNKTHVKKVLTYFNLLDDMTGLDPEEAEQVKSNNEGMLKNTLIPETTSE